ncbi:MAG: xanthine dehydrogenase family protein molybdopterin-binding subunit [Lachnospiraceae bacterium]|jgi:CO/xanthine dehydrogenase Mo-binding subunit|nr:xanthine dehydrogenase family protein molybdopterin-binding subunit [Lachnospiraceae bacterium]
MSNYNVEYTDLQYIGKYMPRKDARDIVTGKCIFLDDFSVPGQLYGRSLRSPHAHARILSINTDKAKALKGVRAVLTDSDLPENWLLGWPPSKRPLDSHLRFVGDCVAYVAADTVEIADEALDLIEVEYEVLPAVFDGIAAARPDAEQLYPGQFAGNEIPGGFPPFQRQGLYWHLQRGDTEAGFAESEYIIEEFMEYNKMPTPLAAEPPQVIIRWDGGLDFHCWATSQGSGVFRQLGSFIIPGSNLVVETFNVGGSFGNKHAMTAQFICGAALSMATKRPVKVAMTKTEQLSAYEMRLGSQMKMKIGVGKDGYLKAVKGFWTVDAGAIGNTTQGQIGVGLGEAQIIGGKCVNWDIDTALMATNRIPAGIARGYGGMELNACLSLLYCRAMEAANIDPVEFYKKNYISAGDRFVWRDGLLWKACDVNYVPAIQAAADKFGWKDAWKGWGKPSWVSPDGKRARGAGCAILGNADLGEDNNECIVRISPDIVGDSCHVVLHMDVAECGQGQRSSLCKMVAEILNVPYENVSTTSPGQGNHNPFALGLCGSRGTITYGRPVCMACEDLRDQLFKLAEPKLEVPPDTMELVNFGVRSKHMPERFVAWKHLIPEMLSLVGYGKHVETFGIPACLVFFLEAEVDLETGQTQILRVLSGSDVGKVIDPKSLESQFHGGIGAATMDSALFEETILDKQTGRNLAFNLIEYKWRPFNMFPKFDTSILETPIPSFQFKAMGVGEITGAGSAPAVMQAIYNATGVHVTEYPATPKVILKALGKI